MCQDPDATIRNCRNCENPTALYFASSRSFPHGHFHQLQLPSFVFQNQPPTELKSIYWHSVACISILASSLACPEDLRQVPSFHCASVFPLVKCCFGTLISWALAWPLPYWSQNSCKSFTTDPHKIRPINISFKKVGKEGQRTLNFNSSYTVLSLPKLHAILLQLHVVWGGTKQYRTPVK